MHVGKKKVALFDPKHEGMTNSQMSSSVLGAGSFGIVVAHNENAVKHFYDLEDRKAVLEEAKLQEAARELLQGIVRVPHIYDVSTDIVQFENKPHLYGLTMDCIPTYPTFTSALHVVLGYTQADIDQEWPRDQGLPLSPTNPTRGFHASPEMLEDVWAEQGLAETIDSVAYTMGKSLSILIRGGIVPYDLEWIYGGDGQLYLIDFGMCRFGTVEPMRYLHNVGSWGLGGDYYIPHRDHRGYEAFMKGYAI